MGTPPPTSRRVGNRFGPSKGGHIFGNGLHFPFLTPILGPGVTPGFPRPWVGGYRQDSPSPPALYKQACFNGCCSFVLLTLKMMHGSRVPTLSTKTNKTPVMHFCSSLSFFQVAALSQTSDSGHLHSFMSPRLCGLHTVPFLTNGGGGHSGFLFNRVNAAPNIFHG